MPRPEKMVIRPAPLELTTSLWSWCTLATTGRPIARYSTSFVGVATSCSIFGSIGEMQTSAALM
jgi:hypothetical protein